MASPANPPSVIRFGSYELHAASGELRKNGVSLKIHPQPFRVLVLLAERPGQIVTREEIQRCLWGDHTFVDFERGINFCVNQIRAALGDDAVKPRYVETLPRRGYRFIAAMSNRHPSGPTPTAVSDTLLSLPRGGYPLIMPLRADNPPAQSNPTKEPPVSSAAESSSPIAPVPAVQGLSARPQTLSIGRKWRPVFVIVTLIAVATTIFVFRWSPPQPGS